MQTKVIQNGEDIMIFFNVDFLAILDWCKRMYVIKLIDVPALGMHCLNAVVWLQEMFGQIFPKMTR